MGIRIEWSKIDFLGGSIIMSIYSPDVRASMIYQADPDAARHYHHVRNTLHQTCKPYLNHKVKVQTHDGNTHEGILAGMDSKNVYLFITVSTDQVRGFYNPYYKPYPYPPYPYPGPVSGNAILPLVLYELLAISLL
ncbi:hypothetical protein [Paenibacillus tengchongensis]|uniref:hypothetical protein n=1 Tax=Paenibacillus tengchongensis TaxID=2608684 RepID=UPI00124F4D81|nr:hypothetical protein [Paenibacillus tengchongensis]